MCICVCVCVIKIVDFFFFCCAKGFIGNIYFCLCCIPETGDIVEEKPDKVSLVLS